MARPDLFGEEVVSTVESGTKVDNAYIKVLEKQYEEKFKDDNVSFAEREQARKTIEYNKMQSLDQSKDVLEDSKIKEERLILELNVDAISSQNAGGIDSPEFKDGKEGFDKFADLAIDNKVLTDTSSMLGRSFRQIAYDKGGSKELFAKVTELVNGNKEKTPTYKQPQELVKVLWKRLQYLGFAIKRNESGVIEKMTEELPTIKDFIRAVMTFQGFMKTPAESIRKGFTPSKVDGVVGPLTLEQLIWTAKPIPFPLPQEVKVDQAPVENTSPIVSDKIQSEPLPVEPIVEITPPVLAQPMPTLPDNISTPAVGFDVADYFAHNTKEGWPTMKEGSTTETRVLKSINDYVVSKNLTPEEAAKLTDRLMKTAGTLEKEAGAQAGTWVSYTEDLLETGIVDSLENDEIYEDIEKEFVKTVKNSRIANKKTNDQTGRVTPAMKRKIKARNRAQNPTGWRAAAACLGKGPTIGNKFGGSGKSKTFKARSMADFYEKTLETVEVIKKAEIDPEYVKKAEENLKKNKDNNNDEEITEIEE